VSDLFERINAALPQTQCTRCGFPDCAAYARAIASSQASINQCPPGGAEGIARLAELTGRPIALLNPLNGVEMPRGVAVIDEAWCIGCTLCLPVCPTDAILGSNKRMHTVIESHCTGCELCLPACPVDCISMDTVSGQKTGWAAWSADRADSAKDRFEAHQARRAHDAATRPTSPSLGAPGEGETLSEPLAAPSTAPLPMPSAEQTNLGQAKRAVIEAAMARARAKRSAGT
jgi:Na+-translocating ferredoxin:NAD+ oxidoreductase subunit B